MPMTTWKQTPVLTVPWSSFNHIPDFSASSSYFRRQHTSFKLVGDKVNLHSTIDPISALLQHSVGGIILIFNSFTTKETYAQPTLTSSFLSYFHFNALIWKIISTIECLTFPAIVFLVASLQGSFSLVPIPHESYLSLVTPSLDGNILHYSAC